MSERRWTKLKTRKVRVSDDGSRDGRGVRKERTDQGERAKRKEKKKLHFNIRYAIKYFSYGCNEMCSSATGPQYFRSLNNLVA